MGEFLALPKQIKLRQLVRFVTITLGSSVFPFMAMYYTHYFGTFWTGIVMMLTSLVGFLGTLYGGHLSDAIGRKWVIIVGSFGATGGWLCTILANYPGHTLPGLTLIGILLVEFASSFYAPAYEAMLIDLTDASNRRYVYTLNYWFINIAVMFGAGLAGLFYDRYFFELLLALFVVSLICLGVAYLYFQETKPASHHFEHGSGILATFANYRSVLSDRSFIWYTLGSSLFASIWMQMDNYVPVHLKLHFHTQVLFGQTISSAKMLSIMVFTNTILIVVFMTSVNKLTEKWSLLPQLVVGSAIFSLGMLLTFSFDHLLPIWIAVLIFTLGEMINVPASQVLRAEMMNQEKIGSYTGFVSMANPIGSILAGLLVSISHFGGRLGVQLLFIAIAFTGMSTIVKAAQMKQEGTKHV
ncbi:MDR family MFS transporter [Streptococcus halichoeri]|uniref:MDR family MFS transporter n=1 Tax=Streptococcus halichoeri TaxID=254785 RepID=UPI001C8EC096|nr:MFS transporter [Streptococcus halichoeri]